MSDASSGGSRSPIVPLLAVGAGVAIVAGIWLASVVTERAEQRNEVLLRAECSLFPGVCDSLSAAAPPPPLPTGLAEAVAASAAAWEDFRAAEDSARAVGLWWPRADDSLARLDATLRGAVTDATMLVAAAAAAGGADGPAADRESSAAAVALRYAARARSRFAERAAALVQRRFRPAESEPGEGVSGPNIILGAALPSPTASIDVTLLSGAVRVIGWEEDSVHVRGRLAPGERLAVVEKSVEVDSLMVTDVWRADGSTVSPSVSPDVASTATPAAAAPSARSVGSPPERADLALQVDGLPRGLAAASELELYVPSRSRLAIRAVNGSFVIEGFVGELVLSTLTGNVLLTPVAASDGTPEPPVRLVVQSLTGGITLPVADRVDAFTGTGRVIIGDTLAPPARAGAAVRVRAGRGAVHVGVAGAALVDLESVQGDVHLAGDASAARLVTYAGDVRFTAGDAPPAACVLLPRSAAADTAGRGAGATRCDSSLRDLLVAPEDVMVDAPSPSGVRALSVRGAVPPRR